MRCWFIFLDKISIFLYSKFKKFVLGRDESASSSDDGEMLTAREWARLHGEEKFTAREWAKLQKKIENFIVFGKIFGQNQVFCSKFKKIALGQPFLQCVWRY